METETHTQQQADFEQAVDMKAEDVAQLLAEARRYQDEIADLKAEVERLHEGMRHILKHAADFKYKQDRRIDDFVEGIRDIKHEFMGDVS